MKALENVLNTKYFLFTSRVCMKFAGGVLKDDFWHPRFANPMPLTPVLPPPKSPVHLLPVLNRPITHIVTHYLTGLICDNCTVNSTSPQILLSIKTKQFKFCMSIITFKSYLIRNESQIL